MIYHFEVLVPLPLDDVPHEALQLVVLVVPRAEHLGAVQHHLLELLERDEHEAARVEHLEQLVAEVPGDGLHQPQGPLDRVLGVADLAQVGKDALHGKPEKRYKV